MLYTLLIILFIIVSVLLVLSILFQSSKGDALSGTFGAQSGSILGNRGAATFLSKTSTTLAAAFFIITILISMISAPENTASESVIKKEADRRVAPAAGLPAPQGIDENNTQAEPEN
jgi:preprotein translocase subunit SecG